MEQQPQYPIGLERKDRHRHKHHHELSTLALLFRLTGSVIPQIIVYVFYSFLSPINLRAVPPFC
ncbi:hypothetical protein HK096_005214 [Nowakowskiella sp. JEL0078]|nr:hypothetical protein HK096_005214 [Nowakowskiella sp. JEL0078]